MSEVYVDSSAAERKVYLDIPVTPEGGTVEVYLKDDVGNTLYTFNTVTFESDKYSVVVPYAYVGSERLMRVEWTFDYIEDGVRYTSTKNTRFNVVQPILSLEEIKTIVTDATDAEAIALEKAVRQIIYAHTGQAFGLFEGTKTVRGDGRGVLSLPSRLLEVKTIGGNIYSPKLYTISGSGWYLEGPLFGIPNIKSDYYGYHEINGIVTNPNLVNPTALATNGEFVIDGLWGWYEVPDAVQEAARLLVNDYGCADSIYRDRYLDQVSATDWRIQFNSGAFNKTGNVRADQLLNNYILKRGWAVI